MTRPCRSTERPLWAIRAGRVEYRAAWEWQKRLAACRQADIVPDTLLLLEHPPTYTLGRRSDPAHLLADSAWLAREGAAVVEVDRGGDITYHGPGQLVGYPILHLDSIGRDLHRYLRQIEEALIRALAEFGVVGERDPRYTGVWCGTEKVAAIGIKASRNVTWHGFALNVDPNLAHFSAIIPCGIVDRGVTSLRRLLGRPVDLESVADAVVRAFAAVFDRRAVGVRLAELPSTAAPPTALRSPV